jgi:hypothetical protein
VVAGVLESGDPAEALRLANAAQNRPHEPTETGASAVAQLLPPTIRVLSPAPETLQTDTRLTLLYHVRSDTGPVTRVEARIDGRPAKVLDEIQPPNMDAAQEWAGQISIQVHFAKDDVATYAAGIQLYAQAQAGFNGLIERLKVQLIANGEITTNKAFDIELRRAVNRRIALTRFVDAEVLAKQPKGSRSLADALGGADMISSGAELITALKDAALDIWRAFREADSEQRDAMQTQLDGLQWRQFQDVPPLA